MSDDLTPAEQARAARWAKDWLADAGFDVSDTACDAMSSLSFHADKLDPPETVESLRAERDKALADRMDFQRERYRIAAALDTQTQELDAAREKLAAAECVIRDHQAALNAMRDERQAVWGNALRANARFDEEVKKLNAANDTIDRLRSTHVEAEAAWERCKRQPRVWAAGDAEPDGVDLVADHVGELWTECRGEWWTRQKLPAWSWRELVDHRFPLTEVLDED